MRHRARPSPLVILVDYDGTLVPIRRRPSEARPSARTRRTLASLGRCPGVLVGVVSGRSVSWLRQQLRLSGIVYVGNHGLEIQGRGIRFVHPAGRRSVPELARVAARLRASVRGIPGALVEDKGLSLSVHWRAVPVRSHRRFSDRVHRTLAPWRARHAVRVTRGKRVVEVRPPVMWGKGHAVQWLTRQIRCPAGNVWYLGDDRTDEDALRAVARMKGVGILIAARRRRSVATWWLRNPREVRALFHRLLEERRWTNRRDN